MIQDINCDVNQAIYFKRDKQVHVGYVNKLTIAGIELAVNITNLVDPIAYPETMNVVGVMDYCFWSGVATQPVRISFLVDNDNQVAILNLLSAGLANTNVTIEFSIYYFDPRPTFRSYYPCFWTHAEPLAGTISTEGSNLALKISLESDPIIPIPYLYRCDLSFGPPTGVQQCLFLAKTSTDKSVALFGSY